MRELKALLPEADFLTEEETVDHNTNASHRWIIDPLDGTTNFLFGLPCFSVSIALETDGELVLGVVYEPNREECFSAWAGGGAYLNGQAIKVRSNEQLAKSLLATGFPYYDVQVELPASELAILPSNLTLIPGMPAEAFMQTESRTVLNYLLTPALDAMRRAGREQ